MRDENYSMALCEVEYILNNTKEDMILKIDKSKEKFLVYYDSLLESV